MGKKRLEELTSAAPKSYSIRLQPGTQVDTPAGKERIEEVLSKSGSLHGFTLLFKDIGDTHQNLVFIGFESDIVLPPDRRSEFLRLCGSNCISASEGLKSGKWKWVSEV